MSSLTNLLIRINMMMRQTTKNHDMRGAVKVLIKYDMRRDIKILIKYHEMRSAMKILIKYHVMRSALAVLIKCIDMWTFLGL